MTPPILERVVKKCLSKDPDERWQSASDLASELKWILEDGLKAGVPVSAVNKRNNRERMAWAVAALALCVAVVVGAIHLRDTGKPVHVVRSSIPPEEGTSILVTGDYSGPAVLSPDGRGLAFVASREEGPASLWVREVTGLHARALAGTEGATFPFWSADGRSLGFFAGGKLKTISVEGGIPTVLCDAPAGRGGTWGTAGTIVFSPQFESALAQVPASGGTPKPATVMDTSKHDSHRWPYFLPDGRHFLYLAITHQRDASSNDGVYVASLDGKERHLVMTGKTNVGYAGGRLLFMHDASLMAQPFNPTTGALQGEAERLAEDVLVDDTICKAAFDASTSGLLAYTSGGLLTSQAVWYDRSGNSLDLIGDKTSNPIAIRLSPDGARLAMGGAGGDVWVHDLKRNVKTRLTFGPGWSFSPIWSSDGQWIAYEAKRAGKYTLYRKHANGMGQEELLLEGDGVTRMAYDWSPAGDSLLFGIGDLTSTGEIWALPLFHDRKPVPLVKGSFFSANARFSPDGHWVSYNSNESGRTEVYVVPFGGGAGKWQVSNAGGTQAIWRRDGRELFYVTADSILVSVPITLKAGGVQVGAVRPLFRVGNPLNNVGLYDPYDVAQDGKRFVIITFPQQASKPITLVTNWMADLKQQ
jgi:Tol biopolymer transport system component